MSTATGRPVRHGGGGEQRDAREVALAPRSGCEGLLHDA